MCALRDLPHESACPERTFATHLDTDPTFGLAALCCVDFIALSETHEGPEDIRVGTAPRIALSAAAVAREHTGLCAEFCT